MAEGKWRPPVCGIGQGAPAFRGWTRSMPSFTGGPEVSRTSSPRVRGRSKCARRRPVAFNTSIPPTSRAKLGLDPSLSRGPTHHEPMRLTRSLVRGRHRPPGRDLPRPLQRRDRRHRHSLRAGTFCGPPGTAGGTRSEPKRQRRTGTRPCAACQSLPTRATAPPPFGVQPESGLAPSKDLRVKGSATDIPGVSLSFKHK